jgi:uracil-DNA glycosylase family 4
VGFFLGAPPKPGSRPRTVLAKARLSPELLARAGCKACPLHRLERTLASPKMPPTGHARPDVYVIGESPGETEDQQNEQFVGISGQYLRPKLPDGLRYRFNNTLRCRPPENRTPEAIELACCMPKQIQDIVESKPKVVLILGGIPLQELIGRTGITAWRGRHLALHLPGHSCWALPSFHPSYLLRTRKKGSDESEYDRVFMRDLVALETLCQESAPDRTLFDNPNGDVKMIVRPDQIIAALDAIDPGLTATDIETRSYRPYDKNSVWLTASISTNDSTIAFPIAHPESKISETNQAKIKAAYLRYLQRCRVVVHNAAFEGEWFLHEFGIENAYSFQLDDTMAQAFVLDERQGVLALDDLSLQYFGLKMKQLAHLNKMRLDQEPLHEVLRYNGRDSLFTYHLWWMQNERLKAEGLEKVYKLQNSRCMTFTLAQYRGITPNQAQLKSFAKELTDEQTKLEAEIGQHELVTKWENTAGKKFNPNSPLAVLALLKRSKLVTNAIKSSDEELLSSIDHPLARLLLQLRKSMKLYGTYVEPLMPPNGKQIHHDGLVHCRFSHLLTSTGRSSSSDPNMQNFPKRGGGVLYRNVIRARHKHKLVAIDYGQIEYRVIGMATNDAAVCNSIWDGTDAHAYWTDRLLDSFPRLVGGREKIKDQKIFKEFRAKVKNRWTFPAFYGSSLYGIASRFGLTEEQLGPLFDDFWDMFAGVKKWQHRLSKQADEDGYVECLTGRRRRMPMTYNQLINSPIQGTASDIVVDAMERLSRYSVREKEPWMQPVLNVHDDLTFDLPDSSELEDMVTFLTREMLDCRFKFINVPLAVEVSVGDTWGGMTEIATITSQDYGLEPRRIIS